MTYQYLAGKSVTEKGDMKWQSLSFWKWKNSDQKPSFSLGVWAIILAIKSNWTVWKACRLSRFKFVAKPRATIKEQQQSWW